MKTLLIYFVLIRHYRVLNVWWYAQMIVAQAKRKGEQLSYRRIIWTLLKGVPNEFQTN